MLHMTMSLLVSLEVVKSENNGQKPRGRHD